MTPGIEFWASLQSPTDLWRPAGIERPSAAIECILDAFYGCAPTAEQTALWRELSPQPWPTAPKRRAAAAVGRRGLKTSGLQAWAVAFEALRPEHDAHAAPGSRVYVAVLAPLIKQAREAMRAIRGALDALKPLGVRFEVRDEGGAPEIVLHAPWLRTERAITVQTADSVAVRGFAVCFAAIDEAAFLGSAEWLRETDRDLLRALGASQVQFPDARLLLTSSCGPPQGEFHRLVTRPPDDTLVVRAPTWITNPRVSEADCRRIAGGDVDAFEQEFASRRWGYSGESYIDAAAVRSCFDAERAGLGPRPGSFVIGLDVGQVNDATAIIVCSSFADESGPGDFVRHVVVDELRLIPSSRRDPTPLERIADQVAELSRRFNGAPVVFDPFNGPTVCQLLEKRGFREAKDADHLHRRRYLQVSMAAQHQTPRWKLVRDLVIGRRLHLHPSHEALARQLAQLRATQMSSGALKVEGRKDDAADVLALAAEVAVTLPPTGGRGGGHAVRRLRWTFVDGHPRCEPFWINVGPDGAETPLHAPPEHHEDFIPYAREMHQKGYSSPAIERALQRDAGRSRFAKAPAPLVT